jgi:integrase
MTHDTRGGIPFRVEKGLKLWRPSSAADTAFGMARVKSERVGLTRDEREGIVFAREWADLYRHPNSLGLPLSVGTLGERTFARLTKSADLRPIKFHGLRHTCASLLLLAGTPIKVVQERLGHKKVEITMGTYAHVLPGMQQSAAERLGSLLHG